MENYKIKIRAFFTHYFPYADIQDDDDIFSLGFTNSLIEMQLLLFLQKNFAIKLADEDKTIENLRTIDAIAALVERKQTTILPS